MSLAPGRDLSHYRLVEQIGEGGMGVVWRATDTTLSRDVAIKVLPEAFARDPDRMARFEREARVLASLNHSCIASIYGVGSAQGVRFLAMELVEGQDLAARIAQGPVPVVEALEMARQIAEALEAAHERGVVHRDLKPANVKVTHDGHVKVLDFGLAKALESETAAPSASAMSQSPTLTGPMTGANVILGTAAYMSPEQARGKSVDRRADIWAFGCLVFEMLTGQRTFEGETVSDLIAKILERDPDLKSLPSATPPRVRDLLQRCLDKDPKHRLRDIGDARIVLEEVLAARSPSGRLLVTDLPGATSATRRAPLVTIAVAGVAGLVIGTALWGAFGPRARIDGEPTCIAVPMPPHIKVQTAMLSQDGRTVVVIGRPKNPDGSVAPEARVYTRSMDQYEFKELPGTQGTLAGGPEDDSRTMVFLAPVAPGASQKRLAHMPLDGGAPATTIVDWNDDWSDGVELRDAYVIREGQASFVRIPKAGGAPSPPVKMDAGRPGVSRYEFVGRVLPGERSALVNVVSYDARGWHYSVGLLNPKTGKVRVVEENGGNAMYSPTGHLLFARGDAILAAPFDLGRMEMRGAPVAVWSGLSTIYAVTPATFSLTRDGALFYRPGQAGGERQMAFLDASGRTEPWSPDRQAVDQVPDVSPDGRRFACSIVNARGIDELWIGTFDHPDLHRLGTDPNADCFSPVWSPDGKRTAYVRFGKDNKDGIYVQSADGGEARRVFEPESEQAFYQPSSWRPDGTALLLNRLEGGKSSLARLDLADGKPESTRLHTLLPSAFNQFIGRYSPDGRLLAYQGDESGKTQCYVVEVRPDGSTGRPIQLRTQGGFVPKWSHDGKTLFVHDERNRLMKVAVTATPELSISAPTEVCDLDKLGVAMWTVLNDGRFFVGLKNENEDEITGYNLVLNWTEALKAKMRAAR